MSSTAYATPLLLELRPSRTLLGILTFTHLGAAAMLFATGLPGWVTVCLGLGVLVSYLWLAARHALLWPAGSVRWLHWGGGGHWQLRCRDGHELSATLSPESVVTPWLTVLLLQPDAGGRARNVVILRDTLDPEVFRRLRVRLRLEPGDSPENGARKALWP